ncbi:MAG: tetratricopeptide repeat protein [Anaerolineae bacterium]|nr:tetratricopeptide repeat protein [Anaerolineae bacterium]NUQ03743.1 tetratricopeptide repeat protein [Anaerolineae bacterium]
MAGGLNQRLGFTRFEADEYYKRALEYYRKREFDNAVDSMTKAIAAFPNQPEYYAARGLMHFDDANFDEARADFEHALKLFKVELLAHYGLGMLAFREEQWDAALEHFRIAYNVNPQRPETLYYLSLTYYHRRDFASAANLMKLAHDQFEANDDKRRGEAARWLRELSKIAEKTAALLQSTQKLPG